MDAALNDSALFQDLSSLQVANTADQGNTESAWWVAFKNGSRPALNFIFDRYARTLYAYGSSITKDHDVVADCVQDVFFELWTKRETVAGDVRSVKFYLLKSVRRKILRRLSADKRSLGSQNIPDDYDAEAAFSIEFSLRQEEASQEVKRHLTAAISALSARQQEAVYLKFYENMPYEHIASVMSIDIKAAYNLIGKSVLSLRKMLKKSAVHH